MQYGATAADAATPAAAHKLVKRLSPSLSRAIGRPKGGMSQRGCEMRRCVLCGRWVLLAFQVDLLLKKLRPRVPVAYQLDARYHGVALFTRSPPLAEAATPPEVVAQ